MAHSIELGAKRNGATAFLNSRGVLGTLLVMDGFANAHGHFWASTRPDNTGALNKASGLAHSTLIRHRTLLREHGCIVQVNRQQLGLYGEHEPKPPRGVVVWAITGWVAPCKDSTCKCSESLQSPVRILNIAHDPGCFDLKHKDSPAFEGTPVEASPAQTARGKKRSGRPRDPFWDTIVDLTGYEAATQRERKVLGKLSQAFKGAGIEAPAIGPMWEAVSRATGQEFITEAAMFAIAEAVIDLLTARPPISPDQVTRWAGDRVREGWDRRMITSESIRKHIGRSGASRPIPQTPPANKPGVVEPPPPALTDEEREAVLRLIEEGKAAIANGKKGVTGDE